MSRGPHADRLCIGRSRGAFIIWASLLLAACGSTGSEQQQVAAAPAAAPPADTLVVYKTPACGCCRAWIEHMEQNGFAVVAHDESATALSHRKREAGIADDLVSCHTARVRGYLVEGHVPADLVRRMLTERPPIAGLAVPGMPAGSPGMEGIRKEKYEVIAFRRDGRREVYDTR